VVVVAEAVAAGPVQAFFARSLGGRYSSITSFTMPSKVDAGKEVPFSVSGHLDSKPEPAWPNFAVGLCYVDGPMEKIVVETGGRTYELGKGYVVYYYREPLPNPCFSISFDGRIKSLDAGSYKFAAMTGCALRDGFYYDDRVDKSVESVAAGWPWWALPLGIGLGVVAVVGGIVAYQEERRRELMLLMMAK
jgi:hypothetical protein